MKAGLQVMVTVLALAAASAYSQQKGLETSPRGTHSEVLPPDGRLSTLLTQNPELTSFEPSSGKKLHVSGPLVRALRATKIAEVPRRLLHLVNPFTPSERGEHLAGDLNPRAWSTMVGLHPGGSTFADATTHESGMGVLTVGR